VKQQRVDERLGFAVTNFHTWCRFGPKYDVTGLTKQFSLHNFPCTIFLAHTHNDEYRVAIVKAWDEGTVCPGEKNGILSELISASFYAQELINFEEIGDEG